MKQKRQVVPSQQDFTHEIVQSCNQALALAVSLVFLAVLTAYSLGPSIPYRPVLCLQKLLFLLAAALLYVLLRAGLVPSSWASLVTSGLAFASNLSVFISLLAGVPSPALVYTQLTMVATANALLSQRWFALNVAGAGSLWVLGLIVRGAAPSPLEGLSLVVFAIFSQGILTLRQRTFEQQYVLLCSNEDYACRLEESLAAAESARAGLDVRVRERSAELSLANEEIRLAGAECESLYGQLLHSQKMESVGRLAGGVAHDFNNLLTVILGSLELLQLKNQPGDDSFQLIEDAQTASQRAAEVTAQLLAFSRKSPVCLRPIDLCQSVRSWERTVSRLLGENILTEYQYTLEVAPILADPTLLEQVILNLVINSRDAMARGGRLRIGVSRAYQRDAEWVALSVEDEGEGIQPEVLHKIFEPFFTTKALGNGSGLGLSMVDGIVAQLKGFIEAESTPGQGTKITCYLPLAQDFAKFHAAGGPGPGSDRRGSGLILVVEDEPLVQKLAVLSLERNGYKVVAASDASQALELCQSMDTAPELLLTDVVLPGTDGSQLASLLKARWPALKVLMVTGYSYDHLSSLGVDSDYELLSKPYDGSQLCSKVNSILAAAEKEEPRPHQHSQ